MIVNDRRDTVSQEEFNELVSTKSYLWTANELGYIFSFINKPDNMTEANMLACANAGHPTLSAYIAGLREMPPSALIVLAKSHLHQVKIAVAKNRRTPVGVVYELYEENVNIPDIVCAAEDRLTRDMIRMAREMKESGQDAKTIGFALNVMEEEAKTAK
jgi:hypothetical protein